MSREIAEILLALSEGIKLAATRLLGGKGAAPAKSAKAVFDAHQEEEAEEDASAEEAAAEESSSDVEAVVIPAPDAVAEMDKEGLMAILSAAGVVKFPAVKVMKGAVEVLSRMLLKDKEGLKEMPTGELRDIAELLGCARKKSADDQIKVMFKEINLEPFAAASAEEAAGEEATEEEVTEEEATEEEETPKSKSKAKSDESEEEEESEGEEESEEESEGVAISDDDAIQWVRDTSDFEPATKEDKAEMEKWVAVKTEPLPIKSKVTALIKKGKLDEAYIVYSSAFVGVDDAGELKMFDFDKPYIRGDQVYCNGTPLAETDEENVGKDIMSGKLFRVTDEGTVVEHKPAAKKAVVTKKGTKPGKK